MNINSTRHWEPNKNLKLSISELYGIDNEGLILINLSKIGFSEESER